MPTIITSAFPPMVKQSFNPYLLDPLMGMFMHINNKIIPLADKKLKIQDVGKKREMEKLIKEFKEVYERKKIEEEEYKAKIKNAKKRSFIPNASETCTFKRLQN